MRTSDIGEMRGEIGLATKLEREAAAWRKRRFDRPNISMGRVQVVRISERPASRLAGRHSDARP